MAEMDFLLLVQVVNSICCLIGFIFFASAWNYSRKIQKLLKETRIVRRWRIATLLVGLFSIGYLINIPLVFIVDLPVLLLIEALVFLGGSIFVLIVFNLAFKTYDLIYSLP
ncbi:MAG: hypothetical protein ACFFE8_12585 [Candidatus Heimdallarchaeota archaeon]